MSSIYHVPAVHFRARAVLTNTASTRPYRSSGRPEAMFVMERLIDLAALQVRLRSHRTAAAQSGAEVRDAVSQSVRHALRQRRLPSGDGARAGLGEWSGFAARARRGSKARGKYRGIGVANYVDTATGVPRERAEITVQPEGAVEVVIGTVSSGQGHETSFAQLVSEWLGVPIDSVRCHRRHRSRLGRRRLAFGTRAPARQHRHAARVRRDHRQGNANCQPRAGGWRGRSGIRRRPLHREGHRPLHRDF